MPGMQERCAHRGRETRTCSIIVVFALPSRRPLRCQTRGRRAARHEVQKAREEKQPMARPQAVHSQKDLSKQSPGLRKTDPVHLISSSLLCSSRSLVSKRAPTSLRSSLHLTRVRARLSSLYKGSCRLTTSRLTRVRASLHSTAIPAD